jgi:hypothetical protein
MFPDIMLTQDRDDAQEWRAALTVSVALIEGEVRGSSVYTPTNCSMIFLLAKRQGQTGPSNVNTYHTTQSSDRQQAEESGHWTASHVGCVTQLVKRINVAQHSKASYIQSSISNRQIPPLLPSESHHFFS